MVCVWRRTARPCNSATMMLGGAVKNCHTFTHPRCTHRWQSRSKKAPAGTSPKTPSAPRCRERVVLAWHSPPGIARILGNCQLCLWIIIIVSLTEHVLRPPCIFYFILECQEVVVTPESGYADCIYLQIVDKLHQIHGETRFGQP